MVVARVPSPPCQHRACNRDDSTAQYRGRRFCVVEAIERAREQPQCDGELPAERGARGGIEYAMTVEQIAQCFGLTTRSIEQTLTVAMRKLRADPRARELLVAYAPEPSGSRSSGRCPRRRSS